MLTSRDRILTTHVGSLPRSALLGDLLVRREAGETIDHALLAVEIDKAVAYVIETQAAAGIDVGNDGEQPRVGFQTYVSQRMSGFGGESRRPLNRELKEIPELVEMQRLRFPRRGRNRNAPAAIGEVRYLDDGPIEREVARLKTLAAGRFAETFMTAPSPGIIATTLINQHYDSEGAYLTALARAMHPEYMAIYRGGLLLQIDAPDLAMARSINFQDKSDAEFVKICEAHVTAINLGLEGIPRDRVRLHVCWGNWDGPHIYDIALEKILPTLAQANVGALSIEFANPRHAHEYGVLERIALPREMILIPGVIESTSNFVEHPEVVAGRIEAAVRAVGDRERVIASTDCGFGTFAGREYVVAPVVWLKLAALRAGADLASIRLWGRTTSPMR
jgi:5-methyltetrahydropteroyltriglutamate--homocysteine methyltransferase